MSLSWIFTSLFAVLVIVVPLVALVAWINIRADRARQDEQRQVETHTQHELSTRQRDLHTRYLQLMAEDPQRSLSSDVSPETFDALMEDTRWMDGTHPSLQSYRRAQAETARIWNQALDSPQGGSGRLPDTAGDLAQLDQALTRLESKLTALRHDIAATTRRTDSDS